MDCPDYLLNRIKYETVLHFDLHICDSYSSFYNERIIFPIYSYNNRGFIARDYTEMKHQKYLFPKNMKKQEYLFYHTLVIIIVTKSEYTIIMKL